METVREALKRRSSRVEVDRLVYINFPQYSAFLLNLGLRGMAIQAMEVLQPGTPFPFSFPLPDTGDEFHGLGRIVWSDKSGRAGLEFTEVESYPRLRLAEWLARQEQMQMQN